jgi:hypothetical protein
MIAVDAGVEHQEPNGNLAFEFVLDTQHGAFGHVRMISQDFFHGSGGKAVAGDVDDVIGTGHDVGIAVFIDITGIGGLVVSGELLQIGFDESFIVLYRVGRVPGGKGSLTTRAPILPGATSSLLSSTTLAGPIREQPWWASRI